MEANCDDAKSCMTGPSAGGTEYQLALAWVNDRGVVRGERLLGGMPVERKKKVMKFQKAEKTMY